MSDNSLLHNFPQWEKLLGKLEDDPFSDIFWNELIMHHEKLANEHADLLRSRKELRLLMYSDFDRLLTKYPYYAKYWTRYTKIVKLLEGVLPSIEILKRATVVFPHSLELWVDYLVNLLTNRVKSDDEIQKLLEHAEDKVGFHFLAHDFWDIYLKWAKFRFGQNSIEYVKVLTKVIKIPLHQYAKYNEEFQKLSQYFTVLDLVSKEELILYIEGKKTKDVISNYDDYIEMNSQDLVKDYFGDLLKEVQIRSQEKWKFESIVRTSFTLSMVTNEELVNWNKYLDYEEAYHSKMPNSNEKELISLYERALIPTCLTSDIWIRYNRYLIQNNGQRNHIIANFNKACDHFVPLDSKDIRYMYIRYMELKEKNIESCKSIYVSTIEKLPNDSELIDHYLEFLINHEAKENQRTLIDDLIKCAHLFNKEYGSDNHLDKKRKPTHNSAKNNLEINSPEIRHLKGLINFWTAGQLIVNACKYMWFVDKDIRRTRDTFMSFLNTEAVKSSKPYWFMAFKFELSQRNKKNLTHIIQQVRSYSTLSISAINLLLTEYTAFMLKNLSASELKQFDRDLYKNIIETDFQSSTHMKTYLKTRLAGGSDSEIIDKRLLRENGHPAATSEGRPQIINSILLTEVTKSENDPYPLPRFRNVEKAGLNVKHIHESL